nr:filamentous hemagglutinin N-terminal domain-containing protein [Xenococcaceae cyanobacterium MO_234.B1]
MKALFKLGFVTSIVSFLLTNPTSAQLIPDKTLGNENSIVNYIDNITKIEGGAIRGNNLFHSFQDFNVNYNQEIFFNNPTNIQSIFTRVTGGNISQIDGLIRNVGQADLFILNPAGIVFGENARLNIGGSFLGTTAESILFSDNTKFSANELQNKPILTVSTPIGLGLANNPGKIINRANLIKEERFGDEQISVNTLVGLEVARNQNITLVGGNIILDGGGLTALGGKIQLGGLATEGIIKIEPNGNLVFPNNSLLSNISLINDASVEVQGNGGGDIIITGQNVAIKDGSTLFAGIRAFEGSSNAQAGDIIINGIDSVVFDGVRSQDSRRGGANFPTIAVNRVGLPLELGRFGFIVNGEGQAGNIEINTKKLDITNGARIVNITFGKGNTGNIIINADAKVSLDGSGSAIFNTIFAGKGNAGDIEINTQSLNLTDGAIISENIFKGEGDLGNIIINAEARVSIDGKSSNPEPGLFAESSIFNTVNDGGVGDGGTIEINTKNLSLTNEGQLFTSTFGTGNAGNVTINATENVNIDRGKIESEVGINNFSGKRGKGDGGTIEINTNNLTVTNQGTLTVSSDADGSVGQILINANSLEIKNQGSIQAETDFKDLDNSLKDSTQNNIVINIDGSLFLQENSLISAKAIEQANGGNVEINADLIVAFPQNNDIIASAEGGNGGNIKLTTNSFFGREFVDISASSQFGLDGDVSIAVLEVDPARGLTELPSNIVDASRLIAKSCLAGGAMAEEQNEFVVTGRGGLPANPKESL